MDDPRRELCQFIAVVVVVALDQITKAAAQQWLSDRSLNAGPFVRLELVYNTHGGIGKLAVPRMAAVSVGAVAVTAAVALIVFAGELSMWMSVGLVLSIGGAASNIGDLVVRKRIIDFVTVWRWPTFNLADFAISSGLILSWIGLL